MDDVDLTDLLASLEFTSPHEDVRILDLAGIDTGVVQFPRRTIDGGRVEEQRQLRAVGQIGYQAVEVMYQTDRCGIFLATDKRASGEQQYVVKLVRAEPGESCDLVGGAPIDHPNITKIRAAGTVAPYRYVVHERVEGPPIEEYCDRHRLTLKDRIRCLLRVGYAVEFAHQRWTSHLDVRSVQVTDGGIPKIGPAVALSPLVPEEADYRSPEDKAGEPLTAASDVYSLGVLAHRLLTGAFPSFDEEGSPTPPSAVVTTMSASDRQTATTICAARKTRPRKLARRLRGDLDSILFKVLDPDPEGRYPTVKAFTDELERYIARRPIEARHGGYLYPVARFARRGALWIIPTLAAAILAGVALAGLVSDGLQARVEAQRNAAVADVIKQLIIAQNPEAGQTLTLDLAQAPSMIEKVLPGQPDLQSAVYASLGETLLGLERYEEAEIALRRSLDSYLVLFGSDSLEVATVEGILGRLYLRKGDLTNAELLLDAAWRKHRDHLGAHHEVTAGALDDLSLLYFNQSKLGLAEESRRKALGIRLRRLGERAFKTVESKHNLAAVLLERASYAEAEDLMRQVAESDRLQYGAQSQILATSLNNLGNLLVILGRYPEAETLLREALEIEQQSDGGTKFRLSRALNSLALALRERGELLQAESLLREAVEIRHETLGSDHPAYATVEDNLGLVLLDQGRLLEAEPLLKSALASRSQAFEREHIAVAASLDHVSVLLLAMNELAEAAPLLHEALATRKKLLPEGHPSVAESIRNLGRLQEARGSVYEAQLLFDRALSIRRETLGPSHPDVTESLSDLERVGRSTILR